MLADVGIVKLNKDGSFTWKPRPYAKQLKLV